LGLDEVFCSTGAKNLQRLSVVLIKPSHYDDDGYVIQWLRSAIPSNTLGVLNGLALDCNARRILGEDVEICVSAFDECNTRIRPERIARQLAGQRALVFMVGVQSNQFPRAMDVARPLRKAGIPVCIGGFHVSGCLSMLPELTPELRGAMDLGISLFAGEAEEQRLDQILRDAWEGTLKPLYNYLADLPSIDGAPLPMLPDSTIRCTMGNFTTFDASRGCPFLCSFCTIINVQGRKSRRRSAEDVEQVIRQNLAQGINRFFITDDNFARNPDWEKIFDGIIAMREQEKLNIKFTIQVDTMCHRLPRFIEKAGRAGVRRVFIGLESINPESLAGARKKQNKIAEYRNMLLQWKRAGAIVFAGYIIGFPEDTAESVARDIGIIQRELAIDLLEPHALTPLPGSEDHQKLYNAGVYLDPDLNKYDVEHVTTPHARMSAEEWTKAYKDSWKQFYSLEHMETVLRRAAATGISVENMWALLLWFHGCVVLEDVHPLQGGLVRRKYRKDRRPTLPRENAFVFYPRYWGNFVYKHLKLAQTYWRFRGFVKELKSNPESRSYVDTALTPEREQTAEMLELLTAHAHPPLAVIRPMATPTTLGA